MRRHFIFAIAAAAVFIAGCASAPQEPLAPGVETLEHQFILAKDDRKLREGASPTYALLELDAKTRKWRLLALSKMRIALTRSNQEEIFLTKGFKNAVPAWSNFDMSYKEESTGERINMVFTGGVSDRKRSYGPASSRFAYAVSQQAMPTLSGIWSSVSYYKMDRKELRSAISQTNLLEEAAAWATGRKSYPDLAPAVAALQLPDMVWEITPSREGEKGRYYFVPSTATLEFDEVVDAGSVVFFYRLTGFAGEEMTPLTSLTRFRADTISPPVGNSERGCTWAWMDVAGKPNNDRQRFCGFNNHQGGNWALPLYAKSPTLGVMKIQEVRGKSYRLDGTQMTIKNLRFSVDSNGIKQYRLLAADEAARVKAVFR